MKLISAQSDKYSAVMLKSNKNQKDMQIIIKYTIITSHLSVRNEALSKQFVVKRFACNEIT